MVLLIKKIIIDHVYQTDEQMSYIISIIVFNVIEICLEITIYFIFKFIGIV